MKLGVDIGVQYLDKMDQTMGYDTQNVQAGEKIHTKAFTISRWGSHGGGEERRGNLRGDCLTSLHGGPSAQEERHPCSLSDQSDHHAPTISLQGCPGGRRIQGRVS